MVVCCFLRKVSARFLQEKCSASLKKRIVFTRKPFLGSTNGTENGIFSALGSAFSFVSIL